MILRRFMKHVTDQNWFAVGLDMLVVVTGIFLGLQVSEWNEGRKDRQEEQAFLQRIYIDQKISLASVEERASDMLKRSQEMKILLDYLEGFDSNVPPQQVLQNSLCLWFAPPASEVQNFAFEELVSSGRLQLLTDSKLRILLQKVQRKHEAVKFDFGVLTMPVQNKARLLEKYINWKIIRGEGVSLATDDNNGTECVIDLDGLKQSSSAQSIIAQLYRSQLIYYTFRKEQTDTVREALEYIEQVLVKNQSE